MAAIVLATINARYIHASIALRSLYANLDDLRHTCVIQEYCLDDQLSDICERVLKQQPKIVGLGVYIWNAALMSQLIIQMKQLAPHVIIIIGGPEASHLPWRVDLSGADYCIQGEGELAFAQLCAAILAGKAPREKMIAASAPDLFTLKLPYPHYTEQDLAHRITYVEASRGCPFCCEFCLSSLDKSLRFFDQQQVLSSLAQLWRRGARTFKFVDRSFNLNQEITLVILDFFLAQPPPFHVHFEVIPEYFPPAIKERLRRFAPGTLQLEIGLQTLSPEIAARIGRRINVERLRRNLAFLDQETNAHLHLDLIIGLPGESLEQFGRHVDSLVALTAGEIQLGVLKKLSGVSLGRHDTRYGMAYSSFPPYELLCNDLIGFPQMQAMKRMSRFWDLIYNSGNFIRSVALLWPRGDVFRQFFTFSDWLYANTRATWRIALPRLTELFFTYLVQEQGLNPEAAANALAADILGVRGRVLPEKIQRHVTQLPIAQRMLQDGLQRRQERRAKVKA